MDLDPRKASSAEQPAQPDVMNTSVESLQPPSEAQSIQGDTVVSSAPDATQITTDASATTEDETLESFKPLLLGQKVYAPQQPHPLQDLITFYGLLPLATSVARNDPITGEKVNKMRKSYEGQVKGFGLAGRNKAVKHEPGMSGGLVELIEWPEEEWQNQKVFGKELEKGLSGAMFAKLEKAMKMEPGPVPRNDEWEHVLGLEKLKAPIPAVETKGKTAPQPGPRFQKVNGLVNGMTVGIVAAGDVARPKRTGRKRRYDEHSFEGYGEGYVDDDADAMNAGGYSSGEGSRNSNVSKKKRKQEYAPINTPKIPERGGSYGPGMIHVLSGLGAHQR